MTRNPFTCWYLFATNGADAFLLDLVSRRDESFARFVRYRRGHPPQVVRHGFPSGSVNGLPATLGVTLGDISLDALGCHGNSPGIQLDAHFSLSGRKMRFSPFYITWAFDNVPDFRSQYGAMDRASCDGSELGGVPVTCSTYSLDDFAGARWVLISAPHFTGTDLAFEISAAHLLGRWMPSAWVFYNGREYRLNSLIDCVFRLHLERAGDVDSGERVFTASLRASGLHIDIEARGPVDQFARLDADLDTEIYTTLFGTCRATVASGGEPFVAERTCLLEVKN